MSEQRPSGSGPRRRLAVQVRDRIAGRTGRPGEPAAPVRGCRLQEVAFVAPFSLGLRLDLSRLVHSEAGRWERDWAARDREVEGTTLGWRTATRSRDRALLFDVDDYQGATIVPRALARLRLDEDTVGTASPAARSVWDEIAAVLGPAARLRTVDVALTPLGLGSITVLCGDLGQRTDSASAVKHAAEAAGSRLGAALARVVETVAADLRAHVADAWTVPGGATRPVGVLWVHRVVALRADDLDTGGAWASRVLLQPEVVPLRSCDDGAESLTLAGIGTSVVVSTGRARAFGDMVAAVGLANVAWAAAQEESDAVLLANVGIGVQRRRARLAEVREMTHGIADADQRASTFRAVLHDQVHAMAPPQIACWERLSDAWRLGAVMDEMDRRRRDLKSSHRETVDHLQSLYSGRLDKVVTGLTVLGGLSVVVAIFDYVFGGPLSGLEGARLLTLGGGAVIFFGLFAWAWKRGERGPRNRRTTPRRWRRA